MKNKTVLLLQGFPGLYGNHPVYRYMRSKKWKVINPDLFCGSELLSVDRIADEINSKLGRRTPDIIIAVSFGGLLAPIFASRYPQAHLLMVATGPRVDMDVHVYDRLVKKGNTKFLRLLFGISRRVPTGMFRTFYRVINPFRARYQNRKFYYENIVETFNNFKKIPPNKIEELALFIRSIDNRKSLNNLKNKTLIITGDRDLMMPRRLSFEMQKLIKNSQLMDNTGRLHFDVFDERDFAKVDDFLEI